MRLLGYILLIVGFVGLSLRLYARGGVTEAIAIHQFQSMPQQETYSRGDVIDAMKKVAAYSWDEGNSSPVRGALIMLLGGILIDVGSRLKKPNPN